MEVQDLPKTSTYVRVKCVLQFETQVTLVICRVCGPANRHEYRKRVKRETYNMPVDFLSDTL
jgi:RNase P subunit RPR2